MAGATRGLRQSDNYTTLLRITPVKRSPSSTHPWKAFLDSMMENGRGQLVKEDIIDAKIKGPGCMKKFEYRLQEQDTVHQPLYPHFSNKLR